MSEHNRNTLLFNTPLETGLRCLIVLNELFPVAIDLQRLITYDYLLVHSGDITNGPSSLHANIPYRAGEIMVRRDLVAEGLSLMASRELVKKSFDSTGIKYAGTNLTSGFLKFFDSAYFSGLVERAKWIQTTFSSIQDQELNALVSSNLDKWGSEFTREAWQRDSHDI